MNSDHVLDVLLQGLRNDALGEPTFELAQRRAIGGQRAINLIYGRMRALQPEVTTQKLQALRSISSVEVQMVLHKAWGFFCEALAKSKEAQRLAFADNSIKAATFSLWETQNAVLALGFLLRELAEMKDPMAYLEGVPTPADVCEAFQGDKPPPRTMLLIIHEKTKHVLLAHDRGSYVALPASVNLPQRRHSLMDGEGLALPAWSDLPRRQFSLVDGDGSIEYDAAPFWCGPNEEAWAYRGLFRPSRRPVGYDSNDPGALFAHAWVGAEGAPRPFHAQAQLAWTAPATVLPRLDANALQVLMESEL